jgi:rSAM/selenodomain-associated transferase 1
MNAVSVHWQQGANIGVRMAQAFQQNFEAGFGRVIVAGSDCPFLTVGHYNRVLQALREHDAVIIPALDGGYVLLGLRRWDQALFSDVPWGTETVFQSTVAKLESMRWCWCALPPLPDIDRVEDLVHLQGLMLEY